ncbi:MAG: murein hydrolase activator EnvC family protein [Bacteroidales bacterium]
MKRCVILLLVFLNIIIALPLAGQVVQRQLKELERKRKDALAQIELINSMINTTKKDATSTLNRIKALGQQIVVRRNYISALNDEITTLDREIRLIDRQVKDLEFELSMKKQSYAKAMQFMSKRNTIYDQLAFLLSAESISQSYRRLRYYKEFALWRRIQSEEIIEKQATLNNKKEELEMTKKSKGTLLTERESERKTLAKEEEKEKQSAQELKKKQGELQAQVKKQRQQADQLNRQIQKVIEEEARRAAEEARKAAEAERKRQAEAAKKGQKGASTQPQRKAESTGGYAMNQAEQKLSSDFATNRGKLPMPVQGSYTIIGRFGTQQHKDHKFVTTENKGIDILVKSGTDARAAFEGVVSKVFVVPGYNNSIIVRHGNYLTVYSNLSQVYVKAGDKVSTRQVLGRIYSDPDENNKSVLHFQLWKETTKLNPELWLAK